jgi:hypothetical protein
MGEDAHATTEHALSIFPSENFQLAFFTRIPIRFAPDFLEQQRNNATKLSRIHPGFRVSWVVPIT